jgi:hypothetical protein
MHERQTRTCDMSVRNSTESPTVRCPCATSCTHSVMPVEIPANMMRPWMMLRTLREIMRERSERRYA